jgi:hypothetical protein
MVRWLAAGGAEVVWGGVVLVGALVAAWRHRHGLR